MFLAATFVSFLLAVSTFAYPKYTEDDVQTLVDVSNNFGYRLQHHLSQRPGNHLISPYGISAMLSALYKGASGRTEEELGSIGYKRIEQKGIDISESHKQLRRMLRKDFKENQFVEANVLLYPSEYSVSQQYKEILQSSYDTLVKKMDYDKETREVAQKINRWVEEQTDGKIMHIADEDELYSSSGLALFNSIYYQAEFDIPLETRSTKQLIFRNQYEGLSKSIPTIEAETRLRYYQDQLFKAVQIPLKGGDMKMLLILPSQHRGMERIQEQLTENKIKQIMRSFQEVQVKLSIPEFRMESTHQLQEDIKSIGITSPFGREADFSEITTSGNTRVSRMIQKVIIKVTAVNKKNEYELESWKSIHGNERGVEFKADRPFLFYIIHQATGLYLFSGRVTEL